MNLNLYLLSQKEACGYDTYDACVVAAPDEATARSFHPGTMQFEPNDGERWEDPRLRYSGVWTSYVHLIEVELIGVAAPDVKPGFILASFNAG